MLLMIWIWIGVMTEQMITLLIAFNSVTVYCFISY